MTMKRYRIEDALGLASITPSPDKAVSSETSELSSARLTEIMIAIQELR